MNWSRRDWLILIGLTILAAALRLYKLGVVPPGFQFDEAFNAIDAAGVMAGNRPLFLPANAGREALYTYWQVAIIRLAGGEITPYTLRLGSALAGIIAVPTAYVLLRGMLRQQSRQVAFFASAAFAINLWHIHFSHFGIRTIMMPMIFSGAFGFFWLGVHGQRASVRLGAFLLSGLFTGLSVWTHPTGRLAPFVLVGYALWVLWHMPRDERLRFAKPLSHPLIGLVVTGVISFVIFVPLGLQFLERPDFFFEHAGEAFVMNEEVSGGTPLATLGDHVLRVLGMFTLRGDVDWTHNVPGRPAFDPLMAIPFLIGVALWVFRIARRSDPDRDALVLLGLWLAIMLLPSILSNDAPDFSRTIPTHPALFVSVGLGLTWLAGHTWWVPWSGRALAAAILILSGVWAFYDYFIAFPQRTELYYVYDVDKLDALNELEPLTEGNQVYLSRLWAGHATVTFLRGEYGIKSIDTSDTVVLPPPGLGAVYAFPREQEERAEQIAEVLPGATQTSVADPFGNTLLHIVQTDAANLVDWPPALAPEQTKIAYFDDGPTLLGLRTDPEDAALTLFWRAEDRMLRNLTSFVHLIDADGRRVGQIDKIPGNGSYPTPTWSPGERVIDRYRPDIDDPCVGGETVNVVVGWYEWLADSARRPRADAAGDIAMAGAMTLPIWSFPAEQAQPEIRMDAASTDSIRPLGLTLHSSDLQPGAPLLLDLYWVNANAGADPAARLRLQNDTEAFTLWEGAIVPDEAEWPAGAAVCRRLRLRLPDDIAAGTYDLQVVGGPAGANPAATLSTVDVAASTRAFQLPQDVRPVDAIFGHESAEIRLHGYELETPTPRGNLTVTLVWQAQAVPQERYKAFVHLVNDDGTIVAQSDAEPHSAYPTNQWVSGEVVTDTHDLSWSDAPPEGSYRLLVGFYDPLSGQRVPARDADGRSVADDAVELGTVELP